MKRVIQGLLVVALVGSFAGPVDAETMAERKQRLMRKYLRERQSIDQSDLVVADSSIEDERVAESEQFKVPQTAFERQEGSMAPMPAPRPVQVPVEAGRNWWLETAEMEKDPYADPFSSDADPARGSSDSWLQWNAREDSSAYGGGSSSLQRDRRQGNEFPRSRSAYDAPQASEAESVYSRSANEGYNTSRAYSADRGTGIYGRPQPADRTVGSGWGLSTDRGYGSSPSSGMLQSPFPTSSSISDDRSQSPSSGYTPYKSPFQMQRDEQGRTGSRLQPQNNEYVRPNPYQNWKDKNKRWDPTADDNYLDELMRNDRR